MNKQIGNISDLYAKISGINFTKEHTNIDNVFESTMKKFNIRSLKELNEDDKKEFYDQIHAGLTGNKIENDTNSKKTVDSTAAFAKKSGIEDLKKTYAQYTIVDDESLTKLSPEQLAAYTDFLRGIHGDMGKFISPDEFVKKLNSGQKIFNMKESEQDEFKNNNKPSDNNAISNDPNSVKTVDSTLEFKRKTEMDEIERKFGKWTQNDNESLSKMSPEQLDSYVKFMQDAGDDTSKYVSPVDFLSKMNTAQKTMTSLKESYDEYSYFYDRVFSKIDSAEQVILTENLMLGMMKDYKSKDALSFFASKRRDEISTK